MRMMPRTTFKMPKYLQINLKCCKAAQALMHQTALEEKVDFILTSELHRTEGSNWYVDTTSKAAIVNVQKIRLEKEGKGEAGFSWVTAHGITLFSCYWFPNSTINEYINFLNRLENSIRSEPTEVLLTGDFNTKHIDWGCPISDRRGEALIDLVNATGLVICNRGKASTFT